MSTQFTSAQLATLKAAILANTDPTFVGYRTAGATGAMANWYNLTASPAAPAWRTDALITDILDGINWTLYTPQDTPDNTATFTNRALVIQTKQMNLQSMVQGRISLDASKANTRSGLRDATVAVPAGVVGANVSPGGASGATVLAACVRNATYAEALFFTATNVTTGTTSASQFGWQGSVTDADIVAALGS